MRESLADVSNPETGGKVPLKEVIG